LTACSRDNKKGQGYYPYPLFFFYIMNAGQQLPDTL